MMYNPVNNEVTDSDRLREKDLREKNKKKRYDVRHVAEVTTREETLAEIERLEKMALAKVSHKRVAEELDRGFDIINNGGLGGGLARIQTNEYMQVKPKAWEMITPRKAL